MLMLRMTSLQWPLGLLLLPPSPTLKKFPKVLLATQVEGLLTSSNSRLTIMSKPTGDPIQVRTSWDDVLTWLHDQSDGGGEVQVASRDTNNCGETPLHILLNMGTRYQHQQLDMLHVKRSCNACHVPDGRPKGKP